MININTSLGNLLIRPFTINDIGAQMDYLYNSSKDFLTEIGFDTTKFIGREKHQEQLEQKINGRSSDEFLSMVAVLDNVTIAAVHIHSASEVKAHFHIFDSKLRGKNLGKPILINSLKILMEHNGIEKLTIEPKVDNIPMNKLMLKCEFKFINKSTYSGRMTRSFESNIYSVECINL